VAQKIDSPAVLIFIEDNYEDMELMYPKYRLEEAGYRVVVAGPKANQKYLGKHGYPCNSDAAIADVEERDFVGVICPGGWAPDRLRRIEKVRRWFASSTKPASWWRRSVTAAGCRSRQTCMRAYALPAV